MRNINNPLTHVEAFENRMAENERQKVKGDDGVFADLLHKRNVWLQIQQLPIASATVLVLPSFSPPPHKTE